MPAQKKPSAKPKLNANFKKKLGERLGQVAVKVGFVNALSIVLTNEQLELILKGIEEVDDQGQYYEIPDPGDWGTNLAACIAVTFGEDDEAFEPVVSKKMRASMSAQGIPEDMIQDVYWKMKCECTPSNALMVWMSPDQFEQLEYNSLYVLIGILQKQWSVNTGDKDKNDKPIYKNYNEEPEGVQSFESHSLKLVDFIG